VYEDDYEFAESFGRPQPYGSAGDCYSNSGHCPQGDFSINLKETGFKIKAKQEWELHGKKAVINYVIEVSGDIQEKRQLLHLQLSFRFSLKNHINKCVPVVVAIVAAVSHHATPHFNWT
jgi:hypothetical protein